MSLLNEGLGHYIPSSYQNDFNILFLFYSFCLDLSPFLVIAISPELLTLA
jgi:hypothetical protein